MAPRKKATKAAEESTPVFDISQFREEKRYVWREIDREDGEPLKVKLQDISIRQAVDIPWGMKTPLKETMQVAAQYVAEWSHKAENLETGEVIDVPPPAEAGWEVFELLPNEVASDIVNWLKVPHYMKSLKAESEKKSETASSTTSTKRSGDA